MVEKIRPLLDRVLVKRLANEEKTEGGIIIPDSAKEKAQTGKVIAVGTGRVLNDGRVVPLQVKVGDIVFLPKYAGTEASPEHVIIREEEITFKENVATINIKNLQSGIYFVNLTNNHNQRLTKKLVVNK